MSDCEMGFEPKAGQVLDAAACLLAVVVSANGRVDPREVAELDRLQAYERLGISRGDFLRQADLALEEIGVHLSQTKWLRLSDRSRLLGLQLYVTDPARRLLVCRLSAAVIAADGRVTGDERLVHATLLDHWDVTPTMVAHTVMRERWH